MSRYIILLLIFVLGLFSGISSSYIVFYPQINSLNTSINTFAQLQIKQDDVIQSLELSNNLLNEEINLLKLNNSHLLDQLNETQILLEKLQNSSGMYYEINVDRIKSLVLDMIKTKKIFTFEI